MFASIIGNTAKESYVSGLGMTLQQQMDLHDVEAESCTLLRKFIRLQECSEHHFNANLRQSAKYISLYDAPPKGWAILRIDLKQNPTVPLSPEETGPYWFATNRREFTFTGVSLTRHTEDGTISRHYIGIVSSVCEKTARSMETVG